MPGRAARLLTGVGSWRNLASMRTLRSSCRFVWALAAVLMAVSVSAQVGVRLTRVPDWIVLPARPGQNLIVEAEVLGKPTNVWLAKDSIDTARVPLESVGGNRYQVNLRDLEVMRMLPADAEDGWLRVFAKTGNRVTRSAKISWVRGQPTKGVTCHVRTKDGKHIVCEQGHDPWLDPAEIERIEVHGMEREQARVVAIADGTTMPFVRPKASRRFVLQMNDGVRKSIYQAGELGVHVQHGDRSWWFGFRVVPGSLEPEHPRAIVQQRKRVKLPGSNGWLTLQIGDVTGGTVWVNLVDARNRPVVPARMMGKNDFLEIKLAKKAHVLVLDRLANKLIGQDFAEFRIEDRSGFKPDEIALLLQRVGAAKVTFVREGQDYNATMAQQFLRVRWLNHRGPKLTTEQFVAIASKSSEHGKPYHIKLQGGKVVTALEWFTGQLREIRKEYAAGESSDG